MGLAIAMQAPINATLSKSLATSPLIAALISFFTGTLALLIVAYFSNLLNAALLKGILTQETWKLTGGLLGAFFVCGTVILAPKIGLINMFLIVLFGQLLMGMFLDSIGAFGLQIKPISVTKIFGIGIILVGLIVFFSREIFKWQ